MGTRHLIAVVCDGAYRIAQYGQWDGCPGGQGVTMLKFARGLDTQDKLDAFRASVRATRFLTPEERQAMWRAYLSERHPTVSPEAGFVPFEVVGGFSRLHPELSRDTGARICRLVQDGATCLQDGIAFAADSLFCEWAYVLDLDANTLEVFKGFNKVPLADDERFAFLNDKLDGEYHPVRLVASWPLHALPAKDAFLSSCEPDDADEAAE